MGKKDNNNHENYYMNIATTEFFVFKELPYCPLTETANQSLETTKVLYTNTHTQLQIHKLVTGIIHRQTANF